MCYTSLEHLGRAWRDLWATCHESSPVPTLTRGKYIHKTGFVVNMAATISPLTLSLRLQLHKICEVEDFFERYELLVELIGDDPRIIELMEAQE